jgi:hypothetical protein
MRARILPGGRASALDGPGHRHLGRRRRASARRRSRRGRGGVSRDAEEPGRYDLVCLWDTIEHLERPIETLVKAARWLAPGGTLALTTGDAGSLLARLQGEKWRQIHPPTHLFYFTRPTLARAFAKAGLETVEIRAIGHSRSYRSMLFGLLELGRPNPSRAYRLLTAGGRLDFPVSLNLFDIVLAAARKPRAVEGLARDGVSAR